MKKTLLLILFGLFFNFIVAQNTAQVVVQNISCSNGNTGSIAINNPTGAAPFLYSITGIAYQPNSIFVNLPAGNYTVSVKDANNVVFTKQVVIAPPVPVIVNTQVTFNTINVTASGGNGSYVYGLTANGTYQSSSYFNNLAIGSYTVYVKDVVNGCVYQSNPVVISTVSPVIVDAVNDYFTVISGSNSPSVLNNDTLNGLPINPSQPQVILSTISAGSIQLNPLGNVIVQLGVPAGTYTLNYQICSAAYPNICDVAIATIVVQRAIDFNMYGTYVDFNNDGFKNVGDLISYQYVIKNNSASTVYDIMLTNPNLTFSGWPIDLAPGQISGDFTSVYVLNQTNINAGYVGNYTNLTSASFGINTSTDSVTNLGITSGIKLSAFIDSNGNGVQDNAEVNFNQGNFSYQLNGGVVQNINTFSGTHYIYETNPANSYNLNYAINPNSNYCGFTLATSSYNNITVAAGSGITTYNFPLVANACTDLAVYLFGNNPRPGFTYYNTIYYVNRGTQTIPAGTITFIKNNVVSILSVSPAATTNTATGFTFNYPSLAPGQSGIVTVTMQVPVIPTVSLGQVLTNSVSISIPGGDTNTANNTNSLSQIIVGSYDPNDKDESHGGKIVQSTFTTNDYLTYTIQFENTGTASAVNIRVNDILDTKLDETSLRMVNTSHPYVLNRVGNTLNWKFDGVNLPPSVANTTTGKGYIVFQIKPKAGFAVGDIIPNTANIYFDFNPAIVTNTFNTQFVQTLSVDTFEANELVLYPNPVQNFLNITSKFVIDSVEVSTVLGQAIVSKRINNLEYNLDLTYLSNGIYFIKVSAEGKEKMIKIVKE